MPSHDSPPDGPLEREAEGRWLTFAELADIRGIDKASAVKLAHRNRFRKQPGNRRGVRVFVPLEWLVKSDTSRDMSHDTSTDMSRVANAFEIAVTVLRERAEAAERARDAEATGRREAEAGLAAERHARQAAEAQAAAEREARAEAEAMAEQARAAVQEATEALQAREEQDAARRARGPLARLRAALRGE